MINAGTVSAPGGTAEMAAGETVVLHDAADNKQLFVETGSAGRTDAKAAGRASIRQSARTHKSFLVTLDEAGRPSRALAQLCQQRREMIGWKYLQHGRNGRALLHRRAQAGASK
jgi:hypothetical protein